MIGTIVQHLRKEAAGELIRTIDRHSVHDPCHIGGLPNDGGVFCMVKIKFDAERIGDEPPDAEVILRPKQVGGEDVAKLLQVVLSLDVVNGKIVAKRGLRNVNVGIGPEFLVVSPRKVPLSIAKEAHKRIAGRAWLRLWL